MSVATRRSRRWKSGKQQHLSAPVLGSVLRHGGHIVGPPVVTGRGTGAEGSPVEVAKSQRKRTGSARTQTWGERRRTREGFLSLVVRL